MSPKPRITLLALGLGAALAGGSGCGGKYLYGPLGAVVAQPRPKGCDFVLIHAPPVRAYDPLGVLAPVDIEAPRAAEAEGPFKSAVAAQVCTAGGDAVVVERDRQGRYIRGTVVKLR